MVNILSSLGSSLCKKASGVGCIKQIRTIATMGELHPPKGSISNQKRVGRGAGSGYGKTSGRGQKGQKARGTVKNWFEGGQTPIFRIYPKRGFYRHQKLDLNEVSLAKIEQFHKQGKISLQEGEVLDMKKMKECGLVSGTMKDGIAIVGTGSRYYTLNIPIEATKASKSAIKIIEKSGGKFTSKFYSRYLGFRAHHSPDWFMRKRGYIPLQAKPIARRDVSFYSDSERNGYLSGSAYVGQIEVGSKGKTKNKVVKKSEIEKELEKFGKTDAAGKDGGYAGFSGNRIVKFSDLQA